MNKETRESFQSAWRRRFEEFAAARDDDAGIAGWSTSGLDARLRNFVRLCADVRAGSRWLDAGCGAGTYSRFLDAHSAQVVGLDYSLLSLAKARARSPASILWVAADATRLPLKSHLFDGAICFGVIQALDRAEPLVESLADVVTPGGEVWIDALNAWCAPHLWERLVRWLKGRPTHTRYEFGHRLRAAFRQAGLQDVRQHWLLILPARLARYQWLVESAPARALFAALPPLAALVSHGFVVRGTKPADNTRT